ncbi:MAG: hypothetical protein IH933_01895 [Euryarchaeota archaeon]|nr:hypothetical protein [Euryarchaeota archaeon]
MKRRQVLGGVAGMVALSGCLGSASDGEHPWPVVDEERLAEWERLSERSDEYNVSYRGIDALTVHERTYTYDYTELRESVAELSQGEIDRSLARFVASRMTLEGVGRRFVTPERLVDDALDGVESGLKDRGMESIERVEPGSPLPDVDGEIVEYRGETDIPSFSREIDVSGFSTTIEFAGEPLETEGVFAVWKPEVDTAYVAGGVFPLADALETLVPESAGIDLVDLLDLEFDPAEFRETFVSLIETTG